MLLWLDFVAFRVFKKITVTSVISLGHCLGSYMFFPSDDVHGCNECIGVSTRCEATYEDEDEMKYLRRLTF